jgi:N-acyl-D-aspartate/D-glutamate deacylase
MFDLVIEGGLVLDGTGAPAQRVDVGVIDGKVEAMRAIGAEEPARERIDATGLIVAPGFVDIHTHLDAQVFWDPFCTPSSVHGVTTVIAGNCGFSIAPLNPNDDGYMLRLLAEVEAIPEEALEAGVPWDWTTFAQYLESVEAAHPAVNFGVMAGHSAIRRAALGPDYATTDAGAAGLARMVELLREAMDAGAIGFSSSWNPIHLDGDGGPVPSRCAPAEELVALSAVLADYPNAQLEFIPIVGRFEERHIDVMIEMSLAARTGLNWNVLIPQDADLVEQQLGASDRAADRGALITALTYPGPIQVRVSAQSRFFRGVPEWEALLDLPTDAAVEQLRDPAARTALKAAATASAAPFATILGSLTVADTHAATTAASSGQTLEAVGAAAGTDAFEALFAIWIADELRTGFLPEPMANGDESWKARIASWSDPRVIIGASDAGAHVHLLSTFDYPVALLAMARDLGAMELPEVVRVLTQAPAQLYGLIDRGTLREGAHADIVIFDAKTVAPGGPGWRDDLPGGAGRIYREPEGIAHVIVNGTEIISPAGLTGERPGHILRHGMSPED